MKGRRPKKRKLEKLVGWGEDDDDMEDRETLETWVERTVVIQDGKTQHSVEAGAQTFPEQKSILMKQMEVSFKTEMAKKHSLTGLVTGTKLTKKEKLKIAAKGCKKVTEWFKAKTTTIEWDDDPDLPELEEIMEIETRENEKILQKKEDADSMCKELVEELVSGIEASAVTRSIMEEVLESGSLGKYRA